MFRVGYEKITPRHFRQHLVEPASGQALCGFGGDQLAHLSRVMEPTSFLAFGSDAEVCKKCLVRASSVSSASAGRDEVPAGGDRDHWAEILQRMAADGNHLLEDRSEHTAVSRSAW